MELFCLKRFPTPISLDDHEGDSIDPLIRRETVTAFQATPTSPDAIWRLAGINDPRFGLTAKRTDQYQRLVYIDAKPPWQSS